jgi:hypothetical protein
VSRFDLAQRLGILPKPSKLREQLVAFKVNDNRSRFATSSDYDSFPVLDIVEEP